MADPYYMPVLPSFRDFSGKLKSGTKGAGTAAGDQIAKELEAAVSKSERAVTRAGDAAEKAQNKVADATGKVRVAQEQYNTALESGDPVKIARAEENLATQRRRQSEATTNAERKSQDLAEAQDDLASAQDRSAKAAQEQADAVTVGRLSAEEAEQATRDLDGAQRVLEVGLLAVGAAAVATAGLLVNLGGDFHQMSRDIRVGTGATGDALAALEDSAMSVATTVPVSFDEAGAAIANLNTSTGDTGESLEYLSSQILNSSNLLGEDGVANSEAFGRALSQWGLDAQAGAESMDGVFATTQQFGVGLGELSGHLTTYGSVLQNADFSMEQASVLFGSLEQAGLSVSRIMPGLNSAFRGWASEGEDVQDMLAGTVNSIADAETAQEALAIATDEFGAEGAQRLTTAIRNGSFALEDFGTALGDTDGLIGTTAEETRSMGEEFQLLKNEAMAELEPMARELFDAMREGGAWLRDNVVPVLQDVAEWIGENSDLVIALGIGLGAMAGTFALVRVGMAAFLALQRAWNVVTLLSTVGMRGLNIAMRANIFGLIAGAIVGLVAGLTWFFTQTETGQRIWEVFTDALSTGWEWVKSAFAAAWDFIQPVMDGLGAAFTWVGEVIGNVFSWMIDNWQIAVSIVFGPLGAIVATAITHWDTLKAAIEVVWQAIQTAILWAWNSIIMPVWNAMQAALGALGSFFQWVWNSVIQPAWNALGAGIQWVWDNIVRPAWDGMRLTLDALGTFFQWVWNSVIRPAWDALGEGIRWVADNVVHPVFDGLRRGLELIETAFQTAVDWIGQQWDKIRGITARPIKFVIDTVYNNGIVAMWNKVADWLPGVDPLDEWRPSWLGDFNTGGVLPGYTPGRDIYQFIDPKTGLQIGLGGGEGIMRPEFVDAVGGPSGIDDLNARARKGLPLGHAGNYAAGGVLPGWGELTTDIQRAMAASVAQAFPNQRITSGTRYAPVGSGFDNHMQGRAVDFGLPGGPLASWIASEYGPSVLELFWDPGPNMVAGNPHGAIGGHSDHVHWAMAHIVDPYTGDVISQEGQGDGGTSPIGGLVRNAMSSIIDPIMDAIPDFGEGPFGQMPRALATKAVDAVKDFIFSKIPGGGGSSDHGDWVGNPGVEQFRGLVESLLREKGHDVGLTGSVLRRMNQESTGDPNAINNWDSNAVAGWPTKGLMQMRDDTFASNMDPGYGNIWDPEHNLRSSLNCAMNEYGSISAAYDRAGGYDEGGYLMPGTTLSINETDKPEPVLTNPQWRDISNLVMATAELLDPLRILARDGRDMVAHVEELADNSRRQLQHQVDQAAAAAWDALPGEVQDALTVADAVGQQFERVAGYLNEKAIAWSKGEWPIGSARIPTVEPGPGWEEFRLDDSLQDVARANLDLAEAVITGELSAGSDPVANAIYDVFGRDPILPDLARIAAGGPNAIEAATTAALEAFATGETARLEEWTESTSQLTEAVLRARDAAIHTGQMVEGAVNGYLNWAMASESQGRQGSWQEYFQHYGGMYGTAQGDWLLGQVGLGGILGGKFKDSFANLLIETAQSPLLAAPEILDGDGRVIGTQLPSEQGETLSPASGTDTLTADLSTMADAREADTDEQAPSGEKTVVIEVEGTHISLEELEKTMGELGGELNGVKIEVRNMKDQAASVTDGVDLLV